MSKIKSLLRPTYHAIKNYLKLYDTKSFSQEGEDLILKRIFEHTKQGFYIDVGAHHPFRFSNTYLFYKQGWRGINIDAMPDSMKLFKRFRPKDINLEIPIGAKEGELEYFIFNEPALNTFDSSKVEPILQKSCYKLIKTQKLSIKPLHQILNQYLPAHQNIDFMSIDVEGLDYEVLSSNDWQKYRPKILLVEALGGGDMKALLDSKTTLFLEKQGYTLFAKTFNTLFFRDKTRS